VANVLNDVRAAEPIAIAPEAAAIAIAVPIVYVVVRMIYVVYSDTRDPLEAGGAAR
jgi:hypothetical protein